MHANGMVAVWLDVAGEDERELNDWYEKEHIEHVVNLDGFISGFRYFCANAPHRFLALYETVDEKAEPGPAFQGIVANPTPWTLRIRALFKKQMRTNHIRRINNGNGGNPDAIVIIRSSHRPTAEAEKALLESLSGCTRYRVFEEAGKPDSWMEIYDFQDPSAASEALQSLTLRDGGCPLIYRAIGTPYVRNFPQ